VNVRELAGTRVMVTGATGGLGGAVAAALSAAGARVVATSRQLSRAQAAAQWLGPDALGVELDVRDEAAVSAAVSEVWDRLGGLDVLVNNAGIGMRTVNPRFLTDPQPGGVPDRILGVPQPGARRPAERACKREESSQGLGVERL
jgi:NAD(P)-dependent dehydrogenase (short-subunit alcohol dehydrogenase family)